ncbi:multidrug ABC transporter permease [Corynebacterium tapiri]|uniref:Multidrug ABC transporter permease n=2 Tax=Corynebacterium tapiri TaxID=1448266 RepID=A0A5C4U1W8_9CORY|nr:multidrug ABC transporter permease [Corynebacterium tapiri]
MNTIASEWTKLRSTASFWWTTGILLFLSVGWTILTVSLSDEFITFGAPTAVAGFAAFGVPVLMIQAIMVVTTERRYGLYPQNFLATPKRWMVILAKLVLYAVIAAVLTLLVILLCYAAAHLIAGDKLPMNLFKDEMGQRYLWAYPLLIALVVVFCQGLGLLLRQTAGTVALALIWFLGLEMTVQLLPKFGDDIIKFMPFKNYGAFIDGTSPFANNNEWVALLIFAAWAFGLWILGVVLTEKSDA